jgi:hypothetical protein
MAFSWSSITQGVSKVTYAYLDEARDNADYLDDNAANVTYDSSVRTTHRSTVYGTNYTANDTSPQRTSNLASPYYNGNDTAPQRTANLASPYYVSNDVSPQRTSNLASPYYNGVDSAPQNGTVYNPNYGGHNGSYDGSKK